nr:protein FAR1-RELATED SEQUENCE 5-like [Ipomoea batatas]
MLNNLRPKITNPITAAATKKVQTVLALNTLFQKLKRCSSRSHLLSPQSHQNPLQFSLFGEYPFFPFPANSSNFRSLPESGQDSPESFLGYPVSNSGSIQLGLCEASEPASLPLVPVTVPTYLSAESMEKGEENGHKETKCEMEISPDGTKQWLPTAKPEETPYVGQQFKTVNQGIVFYQAYVNAMGFYVRRNTMRKTRDGEVAIKYMVCSREGFKPTNKEKNIAMGVCTEPNKRSRVSKRVGCNARILLTRCRKGEYQLHAVELRHTHYLCE